MRGLRGKTFVVVGGGGIGGATVRRLAEEGANVALGDIDLPGAQALVEQVSGAGGNAIAQRCDIVNEASIAALIAAAIETFGGIDGLHANAADMSVVKEDADVLSTPMEVFDRTITADLRGHILCTRLVLPELLKRGGGSLVYTSSDSALKPLDRVYAYSSAKAGLMPLARHIAVTWGRQGIRANVITPGPVLSATFAGSQTKEMLAGWLSTLFSPRLGKPEDIAAMAAFLLSDDAEWINGQTMTVDGGAVMR